MSKLAPSEGRFAHSPQVAIRKYNLNKVAMFPRCNFHGRSVHAGWRKYMIYEAKAPIFARRGMVASQSAIMPSGSIGAYHEECHRKDR